MFFTHLIRTKMHPFYDILLMFLMGSNISILQVTPFSEL